MPIANPSAAAHTAKAISAWASHIGRFSTRLKVSSVSPSPINFTSLGALANPSHDHPSHNAARFAESMFLLMIDGMSPPARKIRWLGHGSPQQLSPSDANSPLTASHGLGLRKAESAKRVDGGAEEDFRFPTLSLLTSARGAIDSG